MLDRPLRRGLPLISFPLQQLEVARSGLEGRQTTRSAATALESPTPGQRCNGRRRADEPAEGEGTKTSASLLAVHCLILRSIS